MELYEGGSPSEKTKATELQADKFDIRKYQGDCNAFQKEV